MEKTEIKSPEQSLNRRELLKVLAAASGGLTAAAFLPARWLKPVIETGVLPAHAQATCCLEISYAYNADLVETNNMCFVEGLVNYQDCLGRMDTLDYVFHLEIEGFVIPNLIYDREGDGYAGTIEFHFSYPGVCVQTEDLPFQMWLVVDNCVSNIINGNDLLTPPNPD